MCVACYEIIKVWHFFLLKNWFYPYWWHFWKVKYKEPLGSCCVNTNWVQVHQQCPKSVSSLIYLQHKVPSPSSKPSLWPDSPAGAEKVQSPSSWVNLSLESEKWQNKSFCTCCDSTLAPFLRITSMMHKCTAITQYCDVICSKQFGMHGVIITSASRRHPAYIW